MPPKKKATGGVKRPRASTTKQKKPPGRPRAKKTAAPVEETVTPAVPDSALDDLLQQLAGLSLRLAVLETHATPPAAATALPTAGKLKAAVKRAPCKRKREDR